MQGGSRNIDGLVPSEAPVSGVVQNQNPDSVSDRVLMSWSGMSFDASERGKLWYVLAGFIVLGIIAYLVYTKSWYLIGITVVVSGVFFWDLFSQKPKEIDFSITTFGIKMGEKFYPFSELHSFWIVYDQKVKKLYLAFLKKYLPALIIDINNADATKLRAILARKLPEQEKRGESFLDYLIRTLRL